MKPFFKPAVLAVAAVVSFCAAPLEAADGTLDRILVVVNDEIISEQDLRSAAEPVVAQYRASLSGSGLEEKVAAAKRQILEQLIDERLVRGVAKREKITIDEKEVDEMMNEVQSKFPSREVFERVMGDQGMSFEKLRERFRDQILGRRVVDMNVKSRVSVSPGDVRNFYDSNPEHFRAPERIRVRHILVRTGDLRSEEEAGLLAQSLVIRMENGESMEALAEQYSEAAEGPGGGDMGWVERGQFVEHIDKEIFNLAVAGRTRPIKSQLGFHIFQAEERTPAETRAFEQVRGRVENYLFKMKTAELLTEYLKELRKKAYIARMVS